MNVTSLQKVVLALAESQTVDSVLQIIVGALAEQSEVALARVWLKEPGDICGTCDMKSSCPDQRFCLHLVASAEFAGCLQAVPLHNEIQSRLGPIVILGDEREVNYEAHKTYDGSAISLDRHSDGARG
jgi:hypothetical protein